VRSTFGHADRFVTVCDETCLNRFAITRRSRPTDIASLFFTSNSFPRPKRDSDFDGWGVRMSSDQLASPASANLKPRSTDWLSYNAAYPVPLHEKMVVVDKKIDIFDI
jgi:hypothetical protein